MSVFFGGGQPERRDAFPVPPIPPNSLAGGNSIRRVDLTTAESAMRKIAVFSAVNLLASVSASLPLAVYRGKGKDKQEVATPAWLLDLGATGHGTGDFIYQLVYSWGLRGNVIGLVGDRDPRTGKPTIIDLQHPDDVKLQVTGEDPMNPSWRINGKLIEDRNQIWHRRRYPVPGRIMGLSPIELHATTIGLGLASMNFGAQWFADGAHPSSILVNDRVSNIDKGTATAVKERFLAAIRGTREPVVLGGGWKYQQIQIAPGESQFLETQAYTSSECARIYGPGMPEILGYDTGGSMTYANIEQRALDLLMFTFNPWLNAIEAALSELLPAPQYVKLDRRELLKADLQTRFLSHQVALRNGFETINEVRLEEDLPMVDWGDEPYLPAMSPAAAAAAVNTDSVGPTPDDNVPAPATPPPAPKKIPAKGK